MYSIIAVKKSMMTGTQQGAHLNRWVFIRITWPIDTPPNAEATLIQSRLLKFLKSI